jgi:hypothetical protein
MSVRRANVRLWSLLPRLLLGAFALGVCREDSAREPTVRHLDQGSVTPLGNIEADPRPHCDST